MNPCIIGLVNTEDSRSSMTESPLSPTFPSYSSIPLLDLSECATSCSPPETIFLPIIEAVPKFLENLTDDELKKEAKNESKNDTISAIVKSLKSLASLVPGQD